MLNRLNRRTVLGYLGFGLSAFIVEYLLFVLLLPLDVHLLVAQSVSFTAGLLVSFFGNRIFTFNQQKSYALSRVAQFWRYMLLAAVNLLLSNIIMHLFVEYLGIEPFIAKAMVMVSIVGWNYVLFNNVIFRSN